MGPEPVTLNGSLAANDDLEQVLARLERIGNTIMNRATGAGPLNLPGPSGIISTRTN